MGTPVTTFGNSSLTAVMDASVLLNVPIVKAPPSHICSLIVMSVIAEASMSYLGLGVQPPDQSLGRMISEAQSYLFVAPWIAVMPGIVIIIMIVGFSLIGESFEE